MKRVAISSWSDDFPCSEYTFEKGVGREDDVAIG